MADNKILKLPSALLSARRRYGLLQKEVAFDAGVGTSYICALERGRHRAVPTDDVIVRLAKVYKDWPDAEPELRWAATHDRVVNLLDEAGHGDMAETVSVALDSVRALRGAERKGLMRLLTKALGSRRFLARLEEDPATAADNDEGEAPID